MTEKDEATSVEVTPRVLTLILADRIIREVDSRYGAVGIFSNLILRNRPENPESKRRYGPEWGVLIELAGFVYDREYTAAFSVTKSDSSEPAAYAIEGTLTPRRGSNDGPSGFLHISIPSLVTYSEGAYVVDFKIDGRSLHTKLMEVTYE